MNISEPPEAEAFLVLKLWQKPFQSTYFLIKYDRKANFNNFDARKYPIFFKFPLFWNL